MSEDNLTVMFHAVRPYPPARSTKMWEYTQRMLQIVKNDIVSDIVLKCITSILIPSTTAFDMTYSGMCETNIGFVRGEDMNLPGDVGIRFTNGKVTLCYVSNVLMCDVDLDACNNTILGTQVVNTARRVIFRLIKRLAHDYNDVVDASTAAALNTPSGMHVYFVKRASPPIDRLFDFLKQTNDARYVFAYAMDRDRGFCDKIADVNSVKGLCSDSTLRDSHSNVAAVPMHPGLTALNDLEKPDVFVPLFELRARSASLFTYVREMSGLVEYVNVYVRIMLLQDARTQCAPHKRMAIFADLKSTYEDLVHKLISFYPRERIDQLVSLCALAFHPATNTFDVAHAFSDRTVRARRILLQVAYNMMSTEGAIAEFDAIQNEFANDSALLNEHIIRLHYDSFTSFRDIKEEVKEIVGGIVSKYGDIPNTSTDAVPFPEVMKSHFPFMGELSYPRTYTY